MTIRGGTAQGPLLGGCLETICWHLKGSSAWVDPEGAILVLETSEEAPPPPYVDSYLTDLEQLGVFDAAAALVVARPYGYAADQSERLWEVVARRTEASGMPGARERRGRPHRPDGHAPVRRPRRGRRDAQDAPPARSGDGSD